MITKRSTKIIILAFAMFFAAVNCIYSLPEVDEVVSGEAEVTVSDSTMHINATDKTIINYQSFNITENESVIINLPSSSSEILNRVIQNNPSYLMGDLSCNGVCILVNSSGIYVGPNANIDAASLALSTRDITNSDFLSGKYVFQKLSDEEVDMLLLNEGKITIQEGGFGVLIAGAVENRGKIIAPAGKIVLAGGDAVKLDMSANGLISVAILEKTASKILDHEGNPITDQIKNTGQLEANGGTVILKAESVTDVFRSAINLDGYVSATKVEEADGVIRIVADGDVAVKTDIQATEVEINTDKDIEVEANIMSDGGDIKLFADFDGDGIGSFSQIDGLIEATGEGNIYIDSSGVMTLGMIKTELGAIKIGTQRSPSSIAGKPHYIHSKGDFEITAMEEGEEVTTLYTDRGDVLKYGTAGKAILEAADGKIEQLVQEPLPGGELKLIGNEFNVSSKAEITHILDNDSDIYIEELVEMSENWVSLEGETTGKVKYLTTHNVVLETQHDVDTAPGVIIPGNQVKISAQRIGSGDSPVGISANLTYIHRIQGDIVISDIWGLGSTICIRGPDPDTDPQTWGAINVNKNTDLILEASGGGLFVSENAVLQAQNLTLLASQTIENYGSLHVENGTLTLTAQGNITSLGSLRAETLYEQGATFIIGGEYIVGKAYVQNADNAIQLTTGDYSGETSDTGNIDVKNNNTITLVGNTIFRADSDQDGVGYFEMGVGSEIIGGGYDLEIYGSENMNLRYITGVGTLTFSESQASSNPYYNQYDSGGINSTNLVINSGVTINMNNNPVTLSGNFTVSGTFVSDSGAFTFSGAGESNITGGSNITFYDLTCTTAAKTLKFKEGETFTINGTLTLTGTSGNEVVLDSQDGSTQFTLKVASAQSVDYVNVSNSDVDDTSGGNITANNSLNGGNNDEGPSGYYWVGLPAIGYSIDGLVYSDQGSTLIGSGVNIVLVINGTNTDNADTDGSSQYSFSGISLSSGDVILVYINGNSVEGNTVAIADAANITGLNIYGNTVIAKHETAGPATNASFSTAKGSLTDVDIIYDVSGSDLIIGSTRDFLVWTGDTYTPGGDLECGGDLVIQASAIFNAAAASTISVAGDWDNSGTFNASTSTVVLDGSDSGHTITSGGSSFNNLTIAGIGTYTMQDALDVDGDLVIGGYSYKKAITIASAEVDENLTDFPVLFSVTDSDLATTGNGGYVVDSNGNDIIFVDGSGNKLDHEIEYYNGTSGQLVAWVKVSSLSSTVDTTIYIHYGNSDIARSQENVSGVWSNGFVAVWHLHDDFNDSANNNDGTNYGSDDATGQIGDGQYFHYDDVGGYDGDYIDCGNDSSLAITGQLTMSAWIKPGDGEHPDTEATYWGYMRILSKKAAWNATSGYGFEIKPVDEFVTPNGSGTDYARAILTGDELDDNWHYVTGVVNGSTGTVYFDGADRTSDSTITALASNTQNLHIGRISGDGKDLFYGTLDEIRISNTTRTAGWVSTEHNNQDSPSAFYPNYSSETQTTGNSATLDAAGLNINAGGSWTNSGAFSHSNTATQVVTFDGAGAYTVTSGGSDFYRMEFNNAAGSWTFQDALTADNDIKIYDTDSASGGVDLNGQTVTIGDDLQLYNATSYLTLGASTVYLADDFLITNASAAIDAGTSTIVLNGSEDATLQTNNQTFNDFTINNTGAGGTDNIIVSGNLDVDGALTITDGDLDVSTNDPDVNIAGDMTVEANGSIDLSAYAGTWTFDGSGSDTLTDNTVAGLNYGAVTVNGSSKTLQLAGSAPVFTFSTLTIGTSDDTLDINGENITITTLDNSGTFKLQGGETVSITNMDTDSGTVEYVGDGDSAADTYTIKDFGAPDYYHLTVNATDTALDIFQLGAALDADGNITILDGELDANGQDIDIAGNWSNSGMFSASTGTVTFDGAVAQTITGSNTWNNLTIANTHASPDDSNDVDPSSYQEVTGTLTVTDGQWTPCTGDDYNNVTIGTNGIMKPDASANINVSGNWSNSGVFTHNSGTVTFDGAGVSNITGPTTFNNLTCTTEGKTLKFKEGETFTIEGTLDLSGGTGQLIVLDSQDGLTQFILKVTSLQTVDHVDVSNSAVDDTGANIQADDSTNNANNDTGPSGSYWVFSTYWDVSGTVYSDRGTTTIADGTVIILVIDGTERSSETTTSGDYFFNDILYPTDQAVLVYIDGGTVEGNTVTIVAAADITGLDIYGNAVVARHENGGPITNATFSDAKGSLTDNDIVYSVSGSDLALDYGVDFIVWTGETYTPGGDLACDDLVIQSNAVFNAAASSTIAVSGDWDNSGTFSSGTSTVILDGSGARSITSGGSSFNNLTIAGIGTYTLQDALDVNGDLTIGGFSYKKAITIDSGEVDADLSNFPVLFSVTDSDLATTGNGGYVTSADGYDIIFVDGSGNKLSHEIEYYNETTGQIIAWVKVPSLLSGSDATIYIHYGNGNIVRSLEDIEGVWSNSYVGVWHLDEASGDVSDSTSYANDGTDYGSDTATGQIGSGREFIRIENDYIDCGDDPSLYIADAITVSAWIFHDENNGHIINRGGGWNDSGYSLFWYNDGIRVELQDTTRSEKDITDNAATTATWQFVAFTWDTTSDTMTTYVQGSPAVNTGDFTGPIGEPAENLNIGRKEQNGTYFGGIIDEARVVSTNRSAGWISTEFNNQSSPSTFYPNYASETRSAGSKAALDANGQDMNIGGSWTNNGGAFTHNSNTVIFDATDTDNTITSGGSSFNNVTISSGTYTLQDAMVVDGDLTSLWVDGYSYRKPVTIESDYVDANLADFPILFSVTDADLIDNVMSGSNYTIKFTNASGTELPYEVEYYDNGTGQLIAWVKADSLSSSADTTLYLYYGSSGTASTENASGVWSNGYVDVWHLDASLEDSIGGQNGTNQGSADISGQIGQGRYFNGTTAYIDMGTYDPGMGQGDWTFSAWVKLDNNFDTNSAESRPIFGQYTAGADNQVITFAGTDNSHSTGNLYAKVEGPTSGNYRYIDGTTDSWTGGAWYYISATYHQSPSHAGLVYVNDASEGSLSDTGDASWQSANYRIGGVQLDQAGDERFEGVIDEVRLSSAERTSGWISTEYNNQNSPSAFHSTGSQNSSVPVLDLSGQDITVTGAFENNGTFKLEGGETVNLTMDTNSGLVEYCGTSSYTGLAAGDEYYDLKFSGSGNFDLDANLEINGDLYITGSVTGDAAGYSYYKTVTIDYNYVDDDLTNFPMLFTVTDSDLATVANGGDVNSAGGYDIIFTDTDGNQLDHEIEKYDPETGELVAWVRIPSLSGSANTTINIHYGNGSVTASQENVSGVWSNDYVAVWHMDDQPANGGTVSESVNGYDGIFADTDGDSDTSASGQIGTAIDFNGDGDHIEDADGENYINGLTAFTLSLWVNSDVVATDKGLIMGKDPNGQDNVFGIRYDNAGASGGGDDVLKAGVTVSGSEQQYESANSTQTTSWQHIALTWSSGNQLGLYLDGVADAPTHNSAAQTGSISGATKLLIGKGAKDDQATEGWQGSIDEVRISGSVRLSGWISTEYNNQYNPGTFFGTGGETRNAPVLNAGSYNINIAGNYTQDEGTFVAPSSVLGLTGNFALTGGTFNHNSGTVAFNASDTDNTINSSGTAFNDVRFVNTATYTLNSDLNVDGTLTFAQDTGYGKEKAITIDHDLVAEDLTNFPVLFSVTDGDLATIANGGDVAHSSGYDIIFTDANGTQLDHEIESYDPASGQIVAWVRVPSVSAGENTVIYMKYGNSGVSTSQENISGVWDSSFVGVWHMDETSGLVYDSTSSSNDGTIFGFAVGEVNRSETGQVDGANDLDLASYPNDPAYILMTDSSSLDITSELTISAWINADDLTNNRTIVAKGASLTSVNYALSTNGTEAQFAFYNGANRTYATSGAGLSTGTWYYVAAAYDDAANSVKVYVNDLNELDTSSTYSLIADDGNLNVSTYTYAPAGVYGFKGSIDEVRISNTDRSSGWLETEYNNQVNPAVFCGEGTEETPMTTIALNGNDIVSSGAFCGEGATLSGTGAVVLDGSGAQSFDPGDVSFYDLTVSNTSAGGAQVSDSLTVTNGLTISSGGILDLQDQDLTATGASFSNDGTLRLEGGQIITGLTMDTDSGTVEYTGDESYTGLAAGDNYYDLHFSGSGTYTLNADLDVNNDLTFASYVWYDANWSSRAQLVVSSSQVDENLTDFPIYVDLSDLPSSFFSAVKSDGSDIVVTTADGKTVLKREVVDIDTVGETGELWFKASSLSSSSDTTFYIYYGNSSADLSDDADVWSNGYLSTWHLNDATSDSTSNSNSLIDTSTASATGKLGDGRDFTGGANLEDSDAESYINGLSAFTLSLWCNADAIGNDYGLVASKTPDGTDNDGINLRYDSAGSDAAGTNLIKASAGTFGWPSSNAMRLESSSGTQSAGWQHLTLTWSSGNQMALYVDGAADTPDYNSDARTTTITGAASFIIGKGPQDTAGGWEGVIDEVHLADTARSAGWVSTEYNNQNAASSFYTAGGNTTLNLNTQSYTITVGGSFDNTEGVLNLTGTGTIIFDDASRISNILGDTIFYHFTCTTASKQLFFEASSNTTVQGTLTLTGGSGTEVQLRSTEDGTQWNIDPQGARNVSYVDVKDSNNTNATNITATNSIDSLNNTGWDITP